LNIIKCQLKSVNSNDYNVSFSSAELARLNRMFPNGVCDWSKSGHGRRVTETPRGECYH
jgi:hypothetical protein